MNTLDVYLAVNYNEDENMLSYGLFFPDIEFNMHGIKVDIEGKEEAIVYVLYVLIEKAQEYLEKGKHLLVFIEPRNEISKDILKTLPYGSQIHMYPLKHIPPQLNKAIYLSTITSKPKIIKVYTDGSYKEGEGGGIGIYFYNNYRPFISEHVSVNSSLSAEIEAIARAIEISKGDLDFGHILLIYTDCLFCLKIILKHEEEFVRLVDRNTLTLIKDISDLIDYKYKNQIFFTKIKAHKYEPEDKRTREYKDWLGNDIADKLSKDGRKQI